MHLRGVPGTGVQAAVSDAGSSLVPALRVERPQGRVTLPEASATGVHHWHSRTGRVVASGGRDPLGCWMTWPRLATYRFSTDRPLIVAHPDVDAPEDAVWDTYRRSVLPMAMQARGWEALHASAVVCAHGVVAFCAVSETGKSSVSYGLTRRGFAQWADDAVVIATERSTISVPLPFEVRLRDSASRLFDGPLPAPQRFAFNGPGTQQHQTPTPLHGICVLERQSNTRLPMVERIEPHTAFRSLLTHAHEFDPGDSERRRRLLQSYLTVVDTVPVYRITFDAGHSSLSVLLDTIVDSLALEPSAAQVVMS